MTALTFAVVFLGLAFLALCFGFVVLCHFVPAALSAPLFHALRCCFARSVTASCPDPARFATVSLRATWCSVLSTFPLTLN